MYAERSDKKNNIHMSPHQNSASRQKTERISIATSRPMDEECMRNEKSGQYNMSSQNVNKTVILLSIDVYAGHWAPTVVGTS